MRRAIGIILAGLGAFLIVSAVLARTYLPGQVIKYPINEYLKTQLVGNNVSYFSASLVKPVSGATMQATTTIKGVPALGTSSTAVWDQFTYLYDQTNHATFQYSLSRLPFDRRTAQLRNCCGANVDGTTIRLTGLPGFAWPFGTQPVTYQLFDTTMKRAVPVRYSGTATVDGISAYRFTETVAGARIGTRTVPASLAGMPGNSNVTLPEMYTAHNTFFVDPTTGAQLNQVVNQRLVLVDAGGTQRMLLLDGSLTFTPQSLKKVVSIDNSARSKITLVEVTLPLVAGLLGVAALIIGIVLARPWRGGREGYGDTSATAPMVSPPA